MRYNFKNFLLLLILPVFLLSCNESIVDPSYELNRDEVKENYDKDVVISEYDGDLFNPDSPTLGLVSNPSIIRVSLTSSLKGDMFKDTYLEVEIDKGSFTCNYESNQLISATYGTLNTFDFSIYYKVNEDYKIQDTTISMKLYNKNLDTYLGYFIYDLNNGTDKATYLIDEVKEVIFPYKNNEPQLVSDNFIDSKIKEALAEKKGK